MNTDILRVCDYAGSGNKQFFFESSMIIPDYKPDVVKILCEKPSVHINSKKTLNDKVILEGEIKAKVFYTTDDYNMPLQSIVWHEDFKESIMIKDAQPEDFLNLKLEVEHMSVEPINERKILIKSVVNSDYRLYKDQKVEVMQEPADSDLQVDCKEIEYNTLAEEKEFVMSIRDAFSLDEENNDISDIIDAEATGKIDEIVIKDDGVTLSGKVNMHILYATDEPRKPFKKMRRIKEFVHQVESKNFTNNSQVFAKLNVPIVRVDTVDNEEGGAEVTLKVDVSGEIIGYNSFVKDVIVDAYSLKNDTKLNKKEIQYRKNYHEIQFDTFAREMIEIKENLPNIEQIVDMSIHPMSFDLKNKEGEMYLDGFININGIYLSDDDERINSFNQEVVIKKAIPDKIDADFDSFDLDINIKDLTHDVLNPKNVELKMKLECKINYTKNIKEEIVNNVEYLDTVNISRPGVTVYYTKPEDTLWGICKKYKTTKDEIFKHNEMLENEFPRHLIITRPKI